MKNVFYIGMGLALAACGGVDGGLGQSQENEETYVMPPEPASADAVEAVGATDPVPEPDAVTGDMEEDAAPDSQDGAGVGEDAGAENAPPVFEPLESISMEQGASVSLDVNPAISDAEDEDASLEITWNTTFVSIEDPGTHVLIIEAPVDWVGTEDVELTVTDTAGASAVTTLTIEVVEGKEGEGGGTVDPPAPCGEVTFSYPVGGASEILVSGEFNGWAGNAADGAYVMLDEDADGIAEVTKVLEPGTYQYKFIVDGAWVQDPNNPNLVDDTFGGFNNVLEVECPPDPAVFGLLDFTNDQDAKSFSAVFGGTLDGVTATLNYEPLGEEVFAAEDQGFSLDLVDLPDGIHDLRVTHEDETLLLKVYTGESPDWRDTNIYFAMTDRFHNGDVANDAPVADVDWRANYQGGDFAGLTEKLANDYFSDLGVEAIWISWPADNPDGYHDGQRVDDFGCGLSPQTANYSPMRYTAYHGYWPKDGYSTDEHFGTLEELKDLVTTAHAKGIRILLDFTANHVHQESPLWSAHADDGWFNTPAEVCEAIGWSKPLTCWFTDYLPDLNYNNKEARDEILDQAMWWAKETGADGFRLDAAKHMEMSFIQSLRWRAEKELELTGVDFYIVGETFTGNTDEINLYVGDDRLHAQFDFPSNVQILQGFARQEIGLSTMDNAVRGIKAAYGEASPLMSTFLGNHDIARFISHASGDLACGAWDVVSNISEGWNNPPGTPADPSAYAKLQLAFTYVMTVPGVPLIYYGDEVGLPGAGDPDNRRFMLFGEELTDLQGASLAFMQALGKVRQDVAALRKGSWSAPLWSEGDFLAYARQLDGQTAIVLLNIGGETKSGTLGVQALGLEEGIQLEERLHGGENGVVESGGVAFDIPAQTAWIWVTP